MSLVNDALKKARMEAARGDAANRNVPYPALGRGEREPSRLWIAGLGAFVLLAGLGGTFLFRAGKQSAQRTDLAIQTRISSAESSADAVPAAPGVPGSGPASGPGKAARSRASDAEPSGGSAGPHAGDRSGTSPGTPAGQATRTDPPALRTETRPEPTPEPSRQQPGPPTTSATQPRPRTPPATKTTPPAGAESASLPTEAASESSGGPDVDEPQTAAARPEPAPQTALAAEYLRSADIPGVGSIELGGIAWSGDRPFALLNGRVVRPGDSVAGLIVEEIQPNAVRLSGEAGDLVFKLK